MTYGLRVLLLLLVSFLCMQDVQNAFAGASDLNTCDLDASVQRFTAANNRAFLNLNILCVIPATRSDVMIPLPFSPQSSSGIFQEPGDAEAQYFYGVIAGHPGFSGIVLPARNTSYHVDLSLAGVTLGLSPTTVAPSGEAIFLPFNKAREFAIANAPSMRVLGWRKLTVKSDFVDYVEPAGVSGSDHTFTLELTNKNEDVFSLTIFLKNGGLTFMELILVALITAVGGGLPMLAVPAPRRRLPLTCVIIGLFLGICGVLWFKFARAGHLDDLGYLLPLAGASGVFTTYLARLLSAWQERRRTRKSTDAPTPHREETGGVAAPTVERDHDREASDDKTNPSLGGDFSAKSGDEG